VFIAAVNTNGRLNPPQSHRPERFALLSERLGPLPLVNHFLQRMGLERYVPSAERRNAVTHAQALGVLLRSILVEREPVYRQQETVDGFAAGMFGIDAAQMQRLTDDRIGRALDRLFDADRGALLTEVAIAVGQRFAVAFDRLHNDSTSIAFCGQYRAAAGRRLRARLRGAAEIDRRVQEILEQYRVARYLKVQRVVREEHSSKQARRGRPGPDTAYRRITRRRFDIEYSIDRDAVAYDEKSDGMYPLLTNDRNLTAAQVLEAHKGQPTIEKRFEQVKTVHEIAPVFLKNEGRIEALFTLYFLALLVQALIERELRLAMQREVIDELPFYPEHRQCRRPTTEQVLRLFSLAQRHRLTQAGETVQVFDVEFTDLQRKILRLLGVSETVYRARA